MITFELIVIKLLIKIFQRIRQAPGVATYETDKVLIEEAERFIRKNE